MSKVSRMAALIGIAEERLEEMKRRYAAAKEKEDAKKGLKGILKVKGKPAKDEKEDKKGGKKGECKGCNKGSRAAAIREMIAADTADVAAAERNNQAVKKQIPGGTDKGDAGRISQHYLSEMKEKFAPQVKVASVRRNLDRLSYAFEKNGYGRIAGLLAVAAQELAEAAEMPEAEEAAAPKKEDKMNEEDLIAAVFDAGDEGDEDEEETETETITEETDEEDEDEEEDEEDEE